MTCFHCSKGFCKNHGYEWSDVKDDGTMTGDITCMHCNYRSDSIDENDEFFESYCKELVRENQYLNGIILVASNQLKEMVEGFRK